jgi:selenocysteine-specific elongation factor
MRVIGTAGHVDHGKSALVQALTGIHPDRLKEEQEREMTIDLGFAWLTLPGEGQDGGEEVGIVDVPGHRDFIENMLAGIGGIDAALFVVAADEGVMPQTREHLAILDILQIPGGVVALTKIDLINDAEWLDLVETDLHDVLYNTVLEDAPIVRVSAKTGAGIESLLQALSACLAERPPRPDLNRPRLPIDRVFTIAGFGTVVTGTLTDGRLRVGDEVEILPGRLKGRVRGLQTHKRKEDAATPGSRTAVNISGIALDAVQRGDVVAHPDSYQPTQRLDVLFRLLPDASQTLRHNTQVKLFSGASETMARLRLLGAEELRPGDEGWLQLEPAQPVVVERGDHYILRRPSPGETLGGGIVVDPHPRRRHKRFSATILKKLETLAQGTPAEIFLQALSSLGAAPLKEVIAKANLGDCEAQAALDELFSTGQVLNLSGTGQPKPDNLIISKGGWEQRNADVLKEVERYHKTHPLRMGIPREELKSRLKGKLHGSARLFNAILDRMVSQESLGESGPFVRLPDHAIHFTPDQQRAIDQLMARFAASPYSPPTLKECQAEVGEDVTTALGELDQLVMVTPNVAFRKQDYERMIAEVRALIEKEGGLTVAQARDHFQTSRRYVLALLEHLDAIGMTVRAGDIRRLKKS